MDNKFDGDTLHLKMVLTIEAIEEVKRLLNTKEYYLDDKGKIRASAGNDVLDSVFKFMT